MSQLIKLSLYKRDGILTSGSYGFDVEDIVTPIRFNSNSKSYFSSKLLKGYLNESFSNSNVEYEATNTLAAKAGTSNKIHATWTKAFSEYNSAMKHPVSMDSSEMYVKVYVYHCEKNKPPLPKAMKLP